MKKAEMEKRLNKFVEVYEYVYENIDEKISDLSVQEIILVACAIYGGK